MSTTSAEATEPGEPLAELLRRQRRRLVAHLTRSLGLAHLALAEDAVQWASLRAFQTWGAQGQPDNPAGWLYRVARHHAIDQLRARQHDEPWPEAGDDAAVSALLSVPAAEVRLAGELDDHELALLFAACHPALPLASQVLVALRALTGLELDTLAELFFSNATALAQRLARARQILSGQTLALPAGAELAPRREAVLTALQLMFTAGLRAGGRQGVPPPPGAADGMQLCWEAIRLARALAAHPHAADADADALAALLCLHGARLTGRLDEAGDIIPLPGQPRDRWDAGLVRMGFVHLRAAQRASVLSRWHLQAGIAAEHALAADYDSTDWVSIARYYEMLVALDGSAAPRLGQAIALAEAGEPARALQQLEALLPGVPQALRAHTLAAMSRAHQRLQAPEAARRALQQAIAAAPHEADARWLSARLAELPSG